MSKKMACIALCIALAALLVGGFTMAWFTAKAEPLQNEFTAGTVMIEAGGTVITNKPYDPSAVYVFGVESQSGHIYRINVPNQAAVKIYETPSLAPGNPNSPNGLAFDKINHRLYFGVYNSESASSSKLYFYDTLNGVLSSADPTPVPGILAGATFGQGYYWFIKNDTDDLYKISFNPDGTINQIIPVAMGFTGGTKSFRFGDVAIDMRDGILYGSSLQGNAIPTDPEFFKYNLNTGTYQEITDHDAARLQIAFGGNGVLYGHSTADGKWYSINKSTGKKTYLFTGTQRFTDLASDISVWNPGDCDKIKYTIRNTGSKKIRLRASTQAEWAFNWNYLWENWDALCFSNKYGEQSAWTLEEFQAAVLELSSPVAVTLCNEGWLQAGDYFYYIGTAPVGPGEEVELCLNVCLSGEDTGNEFQGAWYTLSARFDAIQSSNDAPTELWLVNHWD